MKSPNFEDLFEEPERPRNRELKEARKQCTPKPVAVLCSSCSETAKVPRSTLLNRTRMRCQLCGGAMNRDNEV
ncbi:hypothetical protein RISK_002336 [Rhodopirellula islandica]|uniref:Uncharacterized protein n=1 Tax=Rhodopirellula islandica TaxID=595434 RepID=A0A0J1EJL1_RHOIS|nr:hypothetical protein RISK_002336 [Rhodopirellula islandica]